jgi:hypothetical protein
MTKNMNKNNQHKTNVLKEIREWVRDVVLIVFACGGIALLIYIATFMPTIKSISSSLGGVFFQAEMYGRETGVSAADLPRMIGPRSKETGVAFATSMRDAIVDGSALLQVISQTKVVDSLGPLTRLIAVLRPEQVRLIAGVAEKQILSGNVDRIIDFFASDEQSSLSTRIDSILNGDLMKGMNALGGWLQHNDTQAMFSSMSTAPLAQLTGSAAALLTDMERYHAANALSKLTDVLIRVTDALHKDG